MRLRRVFLIALPLCLFSLAAATIAFSGCDSAQTGNGIIKVPEKPTGAATVDTTVEKVTPDEAEEAGKRIDKAIVAHGGKENLAKLRNLVIRQTGIMELQGPTPAEREYQVQFPDRLRLSVTFTGQGKLDAAVTGNEGWISAFQAGTRDMSSEEVADSKAEPYIFWVFTVRPLRTESLVLKPLPDMEVMGRNTHGVRVMQKDHIAIDLHFDAKTNLLVRVYCRPRESGQIVEREMLLSDHKSFDGAFLPQTWVEKRGGRKVMDFKETEYQFPREFAESVFTKPN